MKLFSDWSGVGFSQGRPSVGSLGIPHCWLSAPFGGLKTTMSPRLGSPKCGPRRFTRTRWPTWSVGTIDGLGILNGLTRKAWMPIARPSATAMITTNSMAELRELFFRFPFLGSFTVATTDLRRCERHQEPAVSDSPASDSPAPPSDSPPDSASADDSEA